MTFNKELRLFFIVFLGNIKQLFKYQIIRLRLNVVIPRPHTVDCITWKYFALRKIKTLKARPHSGVGSFFIHFEWGDVTFRRTALWEAERSFAGVSGCKS